VNRLRSFLTNRSLELIAAAIAFIVYCAFSGPMLLRQSEAPHFVYQSYSFLHGQLALFDKPPNLNDWVLWNGKWYSSFPSFPAVLMMPFVAIHGLAFNDVFFTVCIAAINVGLFVAVLKAFRAKGEHTRSDREIVTLAAFFAFGTVYFYTSIRGEVWFTAHVVGVTLTLIYLLASLGSRAPVIAGLALGLGAVTRANLVYAVPFFFLETVLPTGRWESAGAFVERFKKGLPKLLLFALPMAAVLVVAMWMNHVRFGKWTEFGHGILYNNRVNADVAKYGLFNLHYFPRNFQAAFLLGPTIQFNPFRLGFNGHGMSLFLTTPLLALLAFTKVRARATLALAVTALVIALPGLLYMNDGWFQFGYRFSNDYMPYLFLLLALGGRPINRPFLALGVIGIAVNTWGALVFNR
jgi:hypothetical protein